MNRLFDKAVQGSALATKKEVAEFLDVSSCYVDFLIRAKRITPVHISKKVTRYRVAEIRRLKETYTPRYKRKAVNIADPRVDDFDLATRKECAEYFRISASLWSHLVKIGKAPKPVSNGYFKFWKVGDVRKYSGEKHD